MIMKNHHFFLLSNSPWPLISSLNAFSLLFSILMFFKFGELFCFFVSLLNISFSSFFWWFSYSGEFNLEGLNSMSLEEGLKFSMIMFISSEILFFFSFFWSYFHFFLSPTFETGMSWPPLLTETFDYSKVPMINTLVLMTSGVTITVSHYFLNEGKKILSSYYLFFTIFLGIIFSFLQLMEYNSSFFSISDSTFGTSFFMLTGFHGIHVIIGTTFLTVTLYRFMKLISSKMSSLSFEMSSWYWHFVDVVWIFLYFLIYYLNN